MYDVLKEIERPVSTTEVAKLSSVFSGLIAEEGRILIAIQVSDLKSKKLKGKVAPGIYINKFHKVWGLYHPGTDQSRKLDKDEIETILSLFPAFFTDDTNHQVTIFACHINPNKLASLPLPGTGANPIKKIEQSAIRA